MTQIERLLYDSSLISDAFKKMMWKTGQLSLDTIYSSPKLADLHEDIFELLITPFLSFSNFKIRIKNFGKMSFNLILILKDSAIWDIQKLLEKMPKYSNILGEFKITEDILRTYDDEIEENNRQKIREYLKESGNQNPQMIIEELESGLETQKPYLAHEVQFTSLDLFYRYFPEWHNYFFTLLKDSQAKIEEDERIEAEKKATLYDTMERETLFFDSMRKTFPRSDETWDLLKKHIKRRMNLTLTSEDAAQFFSDKSSFFFFTPRQLEPETEYTRTIDGFRYVICIEGGILTVTENGKKYFNINKRKLNFIRRTVKELLTNQVAITAKDYFEESPGQYLLYKPKKENICEMIISTKNIPTLKLLETVITQDKLDTKYLLFSDTIKKITELVSKSKTNEMLLAFIEDQSRNANLITRFLNWLFSFSVIKSLQVRNSNERTQILNLAKAFAPSLETNISAIEAAANILRSSGKEKEISTILISNASINEKVFQLLRLSSDISGKSRAYVCQNDASKLEFLKLIKTL